MNILTENWHPSQDTLDVLKLNGMSDKHIHDSLNYLKSKFMNIDINTIEGYETWSALFIVFCIKASDEKEKKTRKSSAH